MTLTLMASKAPHGYIGILTNICKVYIIDKLNCKLYPCDCLIQLIAFLSFLIFNLCELACLFFLYSEGDPFEVDLTSQLLMVSTAI